jgi:CubicO group peptidase (beta-lactamase class C family)
MRATALVVLLAAGVAVAQAPAPTVASIDREIREGVYGNVDALFVVKNDGTVIANNKYPRDYREISRGKSSPIGCGFGCTDQTWMHEFNYLHPDWHPYFKGRDVHSLQSVTKSVAATVIGIALGRGEISRLDVPFLSFFKDRDLAKVDPRLRKATLEDVLTMRSGIEWHEQDRPLDDTNTTIQLERSKDWIQFTLSQPMDSDPGTKWAYNSGGSMLLSGIIKSATGKFIDEYANEHLFQPLGIRNYYWKRTPTGHADTEGGLYLSSEDLAKIGVLYLRDGVWNGKRILPEGFVHRATTPHVKSIAGQFDYGYQWWLTRRGTTEIWAGRGFGGQLLIVIPSKGVVAVVHAWNVFGTPARNIFTTLIDALE